MGNNPIGHVDDGVLLEGVHTCRRKIRDHAIDGRPAGTRQDLRLLPHMSPSRKAAQSRREEVHSSDDANHHDGVHDAPLPRAPPGSAGREVDEPEPLLGETLIAAEGGDQLTSEGQRLPSRRRLAVNRLESPELESRPHDRAPARCA